MYLTEKGLALLARIKPLIENRHNALEERIGKELMNGFIAILTACWKKSRRKRGSENRALVIVM